MGEAKRKEKRKQRFLREHPKCCLCGSKRDATTWDHIPPKACFPEGLMPEGFEFPVCQQCNSESRQHDQIFGLYSQLVDFDRDNFSFETTRRLTKGLANNCPEALPAIDIPANRKRNGLRQMGLDRPEGMLLADVPLVGVPVIFGEAATTIGRKLSCALSYREWGRTLNANHRILTGWHQNQNPNAADMTELLGERLPQAVEGTRSNIKNYGSRFVYKYGENKDEDFFFYGAQWGAGSIVWGISAPLALWEDSEGWGTSDGSRHADLQTIFS